MSLILQISKRTRVPCDNYREFLYWEQEKGSFYWIVFDGTKQQIDEELVSELGKEGFEVRRKAE